MTTATQGCQSDKGQAEQNRSSVLPLSGTDKSTDAEVTFPWIAGSMNGGSRVGSKEELHCRTNKIESHCARSITVGGNSEEMAVGGIVVSSREKAPAKKAFEPTDGNDGDPNWNCNKSLKASSFCTCSAPDPKLPDKPPLKETASLTSRPMADGTSVRIRVQSSTI